MNATPAELAAEAVAVSSRLRSFLVEQGRSHDEARRRVIVEATEAVLRAAQALPGTRPTPDALVLDRNAEAEINGLSWFIVEPLPGGFRVIDTGRKEVPSE